MAETVYPQNVLFESRDSTFTGVHGLRSLHRKETIGVHELKVYSKMQWFYYLSFLSCMWRPAFSHLTPLRNSNEKQMRRNAAESAFSNLWSYIVAGTSLSKSSSHLQKWFRILSYSYLPSGVNWVVRRMRVFIPGSSLQNDLLSLSPLRYFLLLTCNSQGFVIAIILFLFWMPLMASKLIKLGFIWLPSCLLLGPSLWWSLCSNVTSSEKPSPKRDSTPIALST